MRQKGFEIWFELLDISDVQPWQDDKGDYLRWFGLTDGAYDLRFDSQSMFQYTDAALSHFGVRKDALNSTAVDYQVARLFHDLTDAMASIVHDAVPSAIHEHVDSPDKLARLARIEKRTVDEPDRAQVRQAVRWLGKRTILNNYLVQGPSLAMWRHGETVYAWCDSTDRRIDGEPVWAYSSFLTAIPVDAFETEVVDFQSRLLDAMETRINAIEQGHQLPATVRVDVAELRATHAAETKNVLESRSPHQPTDWGPVGAALKHLA